MASDRKGGLTFQTDILIMLTVCGITACFYNGLEAVRLIAVCLVSSVVCDITGTLLFCRKIRIKDLFAVNTGLAIALMLPSSAPAWFAAMLCIFAVWVAKLPFGDYDKAPFVPAAAAISFATVVYPDIIFDYTCSSDFITGSSLTSMLQNGNSVNMTLPGIINILAGNCPGALGTTCAFLFIACLVYLAIRRFDKFLTASGFIGICALFALLFPRVLSGRHISLVMELGGGMLLFAAIFLITYPNVKFHSAPVCLAYGAAGGMLCMLIRYFGTFEEGVCFAVLITNALSPLFEKWEKLAFRNSGGEASSP